VKIERRAISAPDVLNEAYNYRRPSAFSRGMRVNFNGLVVLLISGTASIDEHDIQGLLESEGAKWKDVVRTTP
jgi:hypothetical protein